MPTDEQRKREQFEEWQATRPWAVTESAYDLAFAAWLARDAEVKALKADNERLREALVRIEKLPRFYDWSENDEAKVTAFRATAALLRIQRLAETALHDEEGIDDE